MNYVAEENEYYTDETINVDFTFKYIAEEEDIYDFGFEFINHFYCLIFFYFDKEDKNIKFVENDI